VGNVRDLSSARSVRIGTVDHELTLCAERSATRVARHWVMRAVAAAGVGGTVNQVTEVLTGELVDDAVRICAARDDSTVSVRLRVDECRVHVSVTGPAPVMPTQPNPTSLALVEVLCSSWGIGPRAEGERTVWFDIETAD
jgi:hypothetical protein